MDLSTLQARLGEKFGEGDRRLGVPFLATVLVEEVGELAEAARKGDREAVGAEAVDVAFMALSIASVVGADVERGLVSKYLHRSVDEVAEGWEAQGRRGHGAPGEGGGED